MKFIIALFVAMLCIPAQAFTIIASGQSNMCGRGTFGPSPLTADSRVTVWNNANELVNDGDAFISVPNFSNPPWYSGAANNLALWFADSAAVELDTDVKLVLVCRGSRSLETWMPGGEMYVALKRIYQLTGEPPADVFLWHQGESDIGESGCWYKTRLLRLLANMRADGLLAYDAPTIIGTIAEDGADIQAEIDFNTNLYNLATDHPDIFFINLDGTPLYDTKHFSGQGLYDGGQEYWGKYPQ